MWLQLKIYQKLFTLQLAPNVQHNLHTLFVYHTFSALQPLLSAAGAGRTSRSSSHHEPAAESVGMMKVLGGVKLSVPMVELLIHAVDGVRTLCQTVGVGHREGGVADSSSSSEHLTPQTLEVGGAYSGWACVEMLLTYLPLFKTLFAITLATFKKIQSHVRQNNELCHLLVWTQS